MGASFPERHWYRLSWLSALLAPLSLVFGAAVGVRRFTYRAGWRRIERLPVPVVVIGNLVAGGTGKTPLVLWLAEALRARGFRPAIVSRGYGGANEQPCEVAIGGDAVRYGDEPLLLAERSGVPVWIGRDRASAARAAIAAHPDRDLVICDDGLQHYALARDFEIAVEDERGYGNGLLLAGRAAPGAAVPAGRRDRRQRRARPLGRLRDAARAGRLPRRARSAPHGGRGRAARATPACGRGDRQSGAVLRHARDRSGWRSRRTRSPITTPSRPATSISPTATPS